MEPRIQYAQTADGVSIAFWTMGEGMPLVHMPPPFTHIQMEWQFPEMRRWYERLAEKRQLVRYDTRGLGLSQRDDLSEPSLDSLVLDLGAVVDRLGLETFALLGYEHSGPVAIVYAVRHPERVSHLLLWCAYARASDWIRSSRIQATRALIEKDWEIYTETVAHLTFGWSEGEQARRFAALMRESARPEMAQTALRALSEFDVTAFLPQVTRPTLVLHRREAPYPAVDVARDLASRIPDARLALLEGAVVSPYLGDMEAAASAIDEFLGEGEEAAAKVEPAEPGGFRTMLFTDVEGSTALTQRLGDAGARDLLRQHERMVREALKAHGGAELKTMGDGFMASFSSATRALESAIAMQTAFAAHNQSAEEPILVRVGLNAGEPIAEDEDLFGTAVIAAARIVAQARGGEILASDVVRQLVAGKKFRFASRGRMVLKGLEEPVEVYEVLWQGED
jgi:class 3 adenylate cyclase